MALLSADEVRSIFRYVYGEQSGCKLDFKIIHSKADVCGVGTATRVLKDGIYLLCDTQREDFPSHLRHITVTNSPTEGNTCAWRCSGPRKDAPADLNRRRFYSKMTRGVRGSKCGCVWTMVENGIDNTQYRILHVRSKQGRARRTSSNEEEDDGGCIECGKNDKKHLQLQCSGCLVVFCHMKCAGLAAIPEDDWFCSGACERAGAALDHEEEGEPDDADNESVLQEKESPGPTIQARVASARASRSSNNGSDDMRIPAPMAHGHYGLSVARNEESMNLPSPQRTHAYQAMAPQNLAPQNHQPPMAFGSMAAGMPTMPGISQHVYGTIGMLNAVDHGTMLSQQQQAHQVQQAHLQQAAGMYPMGMAMPWTNMPPFPCMLQPQQQAHQILDPFNTEPPQPISTDDDRKRSADESSGNVRPRKRTLRVRDQGQSPPDRQELQYAPQLAAQREEDGTADAPHDVDKTVVVKTEETDDMPVFYSLLCRLNTSIEWAELGFITAQSRATLADLRNVIQSQFTKELGDDWIFSLGPLGPVKLSQEGFPAEKLMKDGNGTAHDPFVLCVVIQE